MVKFWDKLFGGKQEEAEEYSEIDLGEIESSMGEEPAQMFVRVADISGLDDLPELKKEVYNGNMLIVDVSRARKDKLTLERTIKELKQVVGDVHGDIAGVEENLIVVAPAGVRIDRRKVIGGK